MSGEKQPIIRLRGIVKRFYIGQPNELEILHGIDLDVNEGEFVAIVGESGSGKSTLMNIVGALDKPTQGSYLLDGIDMTAAKDGELSALRCRKIGFVFQTFNLIGRTSALKNVELPMLYNGVGAAKRTARAKELLELVGMEKRMDHQPNELSGGQKQRVAIARSLINRPKILLLDEPLGALDLQLRRQMQQELKRLQKKLGITFIYITHDQEEALNMSDRIAVMREGRFEQIGTPAQVYDSPKTAYVARFVGEANIVKGQAGALRGEQVEFAAPGGSAGFLRRGYSFAPGQEVTLAIRGEQAQAVKGAEGPGLAGVVKEKSFAGGMLRIAVELAGGGEFICSRHGIDSELAPGDAVRVLWEPDKACPVDVPAGKGE